MSAGANHFEPSNMHANRSIAPHCKTLTNFPTRSLAETTIASCWPRLQATAVPLLSLRRITPPGFSDLPGGIRDGFLPPRMWFRRRWYVSGCAPGNGMPGVAVSKAGWTGLSSIYASIRGVAHFPRPISTSLKKGSIPHRTPMSNFQVLNSPRPFGKASRPCPNGKEPRSRFALTRKSTVHRARRYWALAYPRWNPCFLEDGERFGVGFWNGDLLNNNNYVRGAL